jgi:hypothetical protein
MKRTAIIIACLVILYPQEIWIFDKVVCLLELKRMYAKAEREPVSKFAKWYEDITCTQCHTKGKP